MFPETRHPPGTFFVPVIRPVIHLFSGSFSRAVAFWLVVVCIGVLFIDVTPAWSRGDTARQFDRLFDILESGDSISEVLDRSKWPKNDRLASYLELELFYHPRYLSTVVRLRRFLKKWPDHPQIRRIIGMLEWRIARFGSDTEASAWFKKHPPRSRTAKLRHLKLLLDQKRYKDSWKLWQPLYRGGVEFKNGLWKRLAPIEGLIGDEDREHRARAFMWQGKKAFFRKVIKTLPAERQDYLLTMEAAYRANKRFKSLLKRLSKKERKNPELWWLRINGLVRHKFRPQAEKLLFGPEGDYLTTKRRQQIRFRLGRDYLVMRKPEKALRVLSLNVREKGAELQDSLWFAAWAAHLSGEKDQARRWFALLAERAASSWRRSQGAYWAAEVSRSKKERRKWLAVAARYPHTFYGLLAREQRGGPLTLPGEPSLKCPSFKKSTRRWIRDLELLKRVGRSYYNGPEIEKMAKKKKLRLTTQLCLALDLDAPDLAIRVAKKLSRKGQRYWSGLYPVPDWTPLPGWGVDPPLVWGMVRQESLFFHRAQSSAAALGVMQLLPATAKGEAKQPGMPASNRYRLQWPPYNMALGQAYLMRQLRRFHGDVVLSLAAYNAGPHRAEKWKKNRPRNGPLTFIEKIPFTETRHYVKKVIHGMILYRLRMYGEASIKSILTPGKPGPRALSRTAPSHNPPLIAPVKRGRIKQVRRVNGVGVPKATPMKRGRLKLIRRIGVPRVKPKKQR